MLIRSQDKKYLINLDLAQGISTGTYHDGEAFLSVKFGVAANDNCIIGRYKNEQRAVEVLDEICKAYEYSFVVEAHIPRETPYMMINNTVFQMPA